jgi:hypothetical protein
MIAQGVSPLRRRPKGFPIALWKPSGCVLSYFWGIVAEPTSSDFAAATDEVGLTRETSWGVSPTQSRERVKGGTPLQGQGTASLVGSGATPQRLSLAGQFKRLPGFLNGTKEMRRMVALLHDLTYNKCIPGDWKMHLSKENSLCTAKMRGKTSRRTKRNSFPPSQRIIWHS